MENRLEVIRENLTKNMLSPEISCSIDEKNIVIKVKSKEKPEIFTYHLFYKHVGEKTLLTWKSSPHYNKITKEEVIYFITHEVEYRFISASFGLTSKRLLKKGYK